MSEIRHLPEDASLEHLKNQAKSLQKSALAGDAESLSRFSAAHPRPISSDPLLTDAQLVIAREYGFDSWPKLKAHVEEKAFERFVERFKTAVDTDNVGEVRSLLKSSSKLKRAIDSPWFSFETPAIVRAASSGNQALIDVLLEAGANVNVRSSWGPGGFGALDNTDIKTAHYLIAKGAYIDITAAAKHGMMDRVRELVEADPSLVNARGGDGMTALHFASSVEICAYLLDHGADINIRDIDHNSTPAQYSMRDLEKLRFLVGRGAEADMYIACRLGDKELAARLLENDPKCLRLRLSDRAYQQVEGGHIYLYTYGMATRPITVAADFGGREFQEYLLRMTSPIDRLLLGCAIGDRQAVDAVLKESPGVVAMLSKDDAAFLSDAGWDNRVEAIKLMLDAGFDVNALGTDNGTALERASIRGWVTSVRLLIDAGGSLELKNQYGGAPLGACIWGSLNWPRQEGDHPACVQALLEAGAAPPEHLRGSTEVQEVLRRFGVPD